VKREAANVAVEALDGRVVISQRAGAVAWIELAPEQVELVCDWLRAARIEAEGPRIEAADPIPGPMLARPDLRRGAKS
jgi:hypothetical protein